MDITASMVKELREKTDAGMLDCKKALTETQGDMQKAVEWLRTKGLMKAGQKATRVAAEGGVHSYIHMGGKIGVLLEVNCQTDFVARTDDFKSFCKDVAMHIAGRDPFATRERYAGFVEVQYRFYAAIEPLYHDDRAWLKEHGAEAGPRLLERARA